MDEISDSAFLRLPAELRLRIYEYLLAPSSSEDVTTINYELSWPYLKNPNQDSFLAQQLDKCRCPFQFSGHSHIYSRYRCVGPYVSLTPRSKAHWVLERPGGPVNLLRPPSEDELAARPSAAILKVSRLVYEEALPMLYRGRNFTFLTTLDPRGRYQSYATQCLLSSFSTIGLTHLTHLSILIQPFEEDCGFTSGIRAYADLCHYLLALPRLQRLNVDVYQLVRHVDDFLKYEEILRPFGVLVRKGIEVKVRNSPLERPVGWPPVFGDVKFKEMGQAFIDRFMEGLKSHVGNGSERIDGMAEVLEDSMAIR